MIPLCNVFFIHIQIPHDGIYVAELTKVRECFGQPELLRIQLHNSILFRMGNFYYPLTILPSCPFASLPIYTSPNSQTTPSRVSFKMILNSFSLSLILSAVAQSFLSRAS
jgi:hypothetical protein